MRDIDQERTTARRIWLACKHHSAEVSFDVIRCAADVAVVEVSSAKEGPQTGTIVMQMRNYKVNQGIPNSKFKTNTSNDSIDGIKTLDFSVAAGLEYELKNGVIFQGRYALGLTNVGGTLVPENDRAFNSAIQFSVGYLF